MVTPQFTSMLLAFLVLVAFGACNPLRPDTPNSNRRAPDSHALPAQYGSVYDASPVETGSIVNVRNAMAQQNSQQNSAGTPLAPLPTFSVPAWEPEHRWQGHLPGDTAKFTPGQQYVSVVTQHTTFYYTDRDLFKPNKWKPTTTEEWEWQISQDRPWDTTTTRTWSSKTALFNTQNNAFDGIPPANTGFITSGQLYRTVVTKGTTFFYTDSDRMFGDQIWTVNPTTVASPTTNPAPNLSVPASTSCDKDKSKVTKPIEPINPVKPKTTKATTVPNGHSTPRPSVRNAEPEPLIPTMPIEDADPDFYPLPTAAPEIRRDSVPGHLRPVLTTFIGRPQGHRTRSHSTWVPRPTLVCDGCAIE